MTALWTTRRRTVLAVCLTLPLLASPSAQAGTHVDRLVARDDHKRGAFSEVRALRAAEQRAEARAREAVIAATTAAPVPRPATTPVAEPATPAKPKAAKPKAAKPEAKAGAAEDAERKPAPKGGAPAPVADYDESTPLDLPTDVQAGPSRAAASGGSLGRTLFGLLVVVGLIYGLTHVLKRMRSGAIGGGAARAGDGLKAVASIPLGANRSIHLVRAGQEYLLVGAAEHGVVPLRTYTEDEARAAGLLDVDARRAARPGTPGEPPAAGLTAAVAKPAASRRDLGALLAELRSRTVRR